MKRQYATLPKTIKNICSLRGHILIARKFERTIRSWRSVLFGFRARSYILRIQISLFLVICAEAQVNFFNIVDVNHIFSKILNFLLISNEKGNSIYSRLYQAQETHSHQDTRALRSIFCIHFCNFLVIYITKKNLFYSKYLKKEKNSWTVFNSQPTPGVVDTSAKF